MAKARRSIRKLIQRSDATAATALRSAPSSAASARPGRLPSAGANERAAAPTAAECDRRLAARVAELVDVHRRQQPVPLGRRGGRRATENQQGGEQRRTAALHRYQRACHRDLPPTADGVASKF